MRKLVKKLLLTTTIAASLTGCGKSNKEITSEEITTEEITTEAEVSEDTKLALTDEEVKQQQLDEFAEQLYVEYKKFYDANKTDKETIKTMINIINGEEAGYSTEEINHALEIVQYSLYSDNLMQLLDNCNAKKMGFEPEDMQMEVLPTPKMSDFILDKETRSLDNLIAYEELRDALVDEILKTGTYSDETTKKISEALISQENAEYDEYKGDMDTSLSVEGIEYVLTAAKLYLCNLTQMVNPTSSYVEDKDGNQYQMSPRSDVNDQGYIESDVIAFVDQFRRNGEEVPTDLALKEKEIELKLVGTKYYNGLCTLLDQILKNAGYTDTLLLDTLKNKKKELLERIQVLEKQKEETLFYMDVASTLNKDENMNGVRLTFNM